MHSIVVVDKPDNWNFHLPDVEVISARQYLTDSRYSDISRARIYNLCQSYRYQSLGYYVSLLAEARGHRCFPNIMTIQDLKSQSIIKIVSDELNKLIQRSLGRIKSSQFELDIYFGKSIAKQHVQLSKQLYDLFPSPLLRVIFRWNEDNNQWMLHNVYPLPLNQISDAQKPYLVEYAQEYFSRKRIRTSSTNKKLIYDLAILTNPEESSPPSDKKALERFHAAAEKVGLRTKFITRHDYSRIPEFDALFIRETTAVNHHTYRFARRGLAEKLVVIDDPGSIAKCANKVYMAEMMKTENIPHPKTMIVHRKNMSEVSSHLGMPYILKQPDGSFSNGVVKVSDPLLADEELNRLLNQSELIIAQEFVPTDFDWRIGIIDRKPLYACKYFMAKNHWQINQWVSKTKFKAGDAHAVPLDTVPPSVLKVALRAANMMGDGLYGVDVKEHNGRVMVIEINDNPSIDAGYEDGILHTDLYLTIMESILRRIRQNKSV